MNDPNIVPLPASYAKGRDMKSLAGRCFARLLHTPRRAGALRRCCAEILFGSCVFILLSGFADRPVAAQIRNVTDDTSTPIPGAGHDYIHLLTETVDPANGSVSVSIQIPIPSGRNLSLPFSIDYDSDGATHLQPAEPGVAALWSNTDYLSQGGWSYAAPVVSASLNTEQTTNGDQCQYTADYVFRDPAGGGHSLNPAGVPVYHGTVTSPPPCNFTSDPAVGTFPIGGDAAYTLMIGSTAATTTYPSTVTGTDGTVFYFPDVGDQETMAIPNGSGGTTYTSFADLEAMPALIEDRNGNKITITDDHNGAFSYQDTLNRTVLSSSGFGPSGASNTLAVSGLSKPYTVTWETISYNYSIPNEQYNSVASQACELSAPAGTLVVVKSINLPNGEQYTFGYDQTYGRLNEITYPDGGWVQYTWKWSDTYSESAIFNGAPIAPATASQNGACQFQYKTPVIATRSVGFTDSSTPVLVQSFTYDTQWGNGSSEPVTTWLSKQTTVNTTDEIRGKTAAVVYTYGSVLATYSMNDIPQNGVAGQIPVENEVQSYDWGVTPSSSAVALETEIKGWYNADEIACNFHTYATGPSTGHYYQYEYGQVSDDKQYDFGQVTSPASQCYNAVPPASTSFTPPSNPVRESVTSYQTFTNALGPEYTSATGTTFAEPSSSIVYDHGTEIAETDYTYDQTALTEIPATQHDETNYGSATAGGRGNATTVTKKCIQNCANAVTTYTYYQTGQVLSATDPCGNSACADMVESSHTTTYSYLDEFTDSDVTGTNAYLTTITYPPVNGITQHRYFKYRYADGQVSFSQDDNNRNAGANVGTTYAYSDSLNRLTEVAYPDGGMTWIAYNDASPSPSVTTCKLISTASGNGTCPISGSPSGSWVSTTAIMDGMWHTVESELTSDPDTPGAADYVNTSYDGSGLVYQLSNPHRSSSSPTDGITTYTYDALGREVVQANPDNTKEWWCYDDLPSAGQGNCNGQLGTAMNVAWVDFADENGNDWQQSMDGLGRLVKVMEPNGTSTTPSMQTTYTYDADNNLVGVTQVGDGTGNRDRSYTYDGLSRLIYAANPESGAATYAYDVNGNLSSKVSPAVDAASGTQTISYCYDVLNRMVDKMYAAAPASCASPSGIAASYSYDSSAISGAANDVGHLVDERTYGAAGSLMSETSPYAYDSMGRITHEQQCTPANCGSSSYTPSYGYDYLGNVANQTIQVAGSTSLLIYSRDGADRLSEIQSLVPQTAEYPSILFEATATGTSPSYSSIGLVSASFGDNTASDTTAVTLERTYDNRMRPTSESDNTSGEEVETVHIYSAGYDAHGNLAQIEDSVLGSWTYGYDTLNRLIKATGGGPYYGQYGCWAYDGFGNRDAEVFQTGVCPSPETSVPATARYNGNNQVTWTSVNGAVNGFSYDDAGNVLNDNLNKYWYDPEGRLCAVQDLITGSITGYVYGAEGQRVAKVSLTSLECPISASSFAVTNSYLLGLGGEQESEWTVSGGSATWSHTNVFGDGSLIATYHDTMVYFAANDWLGTKRAEVSPSGTLSTYFSLPFGNSMTTDGSAPDATELHYTGKERDQESGDDYFDARYYTSGMGGFLSPDPTTGGTANPQSLNKYSYVLGNPLTYIDPTGLGPCDAGQGHQGVECSWSATQSFRLGNPDSYAMDALDAEIPVVDVEDGLVPVFADSIQYSPSGIPTGASIALKGWTIGPITTQIGLFGFTLYSQLATMEPTVGQSAPNNGTPWYHNSCITSALGSGAVSIGLDSIGLIPVAGGAGSVARTLGHQAGYVGIVADNLGGNIIKSVQGTAGAVRGANGLFDTSAQGLISDGLAIAGFIPGLGQGAAVLSMVNDAIKTGIAISKCP